MKKLLILTMAIALVFAGCKKTKMEPIGPTDVRILNLTNVPMNSVTVNTFDSTFNYGTIAAGDTTEYHRFDRAYTRANITAVINGLTFKNDTVYYTYMNYVGQVKVTYRVYIKNEADKKLDMSMNGYDAPLK
jgi:hypothetical protein